ncbi:hypothetical protein [Peribacillus butanolivorans]
MKNPGDYDKVEGSAKGIRISDIGTFTIDAKDSIEVNRLRVQVK